MTVTEFINKLNLALNSNTVYASGGFGASIGNFPSQLNRYYKNTLEKCGKSYAEKVKAAAQNPPAWCFDCVGLVKGILWDWNAKADDVYGGANYESNGVPDVGASASGLISYCKDVSTNFANIVAGELLWLDGHVGVYVGDGMAIECTTAWDDKVQKVECWNVKKTGRGRKWTKHGKLPWVEYEAQKKYTVVLGEYDDLLKAKEVQNALKVLGTTSTIVEK